MVVLTVQLVTLVTLHVNRVVTLSPVDELAHFDNVVRWSKPTLPIDPALPFDQETLREVACRNEHNDAWRVAPTRAVCLTAEHNPQGYSWRGLNGSLGHVPLYYVVTGVSARLARAIVPPFGLLTWARLTGIAWVLGGCYLTLRTARALGIRTLHTTPALALGLVIPSQLAAEAMVNPDAASVLIGALVLLVVVRIDQAELGAWVVLPVAAAAMLVDPSASVALIGGLLFLALGAYRDRDQSRRPSLPRRLIVPVAASAMLCAGLAHFAWGHVFSAVTESASFAESPQEELYTRSNLPISLVLGRSAVFAMFPPTEQPNTPAVLRNEPVLVLAGAAGMLMIAGLLGTLLAARFPKASARLAVATAASLLVSGPLMVLWNYVIARWYFSIPSRYGLPLLPALALLVAHSIGGRTGLVLVSAVAMALSLATAIALL